jgi:hypothetical protein
MSLLLFDQNKERRLNIVLEMNAIVASTSYIYIYPPER